MGSPWECGTGLGIVDVSSGLIFGGGEEEEEREELKNGMGG